MHLSVVVPAYQEESRLGATLGTVVRYLESRFGDAAGRGLVSGDSPDAGSGGWEVLVVDDGSPDRTARVAAEHAGRGVRVLRHPENRGKGAALRSGVLASRGAQVLLTDADLSTPITDLERLEPHLGAASVVIGSRAVADSRLEQRQPLYRELMGKTFNLLVRLLAVPGVHDTQCGFKLLDGAVARELFADLRVDGFAYDVELLWLARRRGHAIAEVGVTWSNSPDSRVSPVRHSLQMLVDLLRMRWRHRKGAR